MKRVELTFRGTALEGIAVEEGGPFRAPRLVGEGVRRVGRDLQYECWEALDRDGEQHRIQIPWCGLELDPLPDWYRIDGRWRRGHRGLGWPAKAAAGVAWLPGLLVVLTFVPSDLPQPGRTACAVAAGALFAGAWAVTAGIMKLQHRVRPDWRVSVGLVASLGYAGLAGLALAGLVRVASQAG